MLGLATLVTACEFEYPEVVVVNRTAEHMLIKNPAFNGCAWTTVLAFGAATAPGRCLPGEDRVHFQRFDAQDYCQEQAEDGTLSGVCPCNGELAEAPDGGMDPGLVNVVPTWFNYQTSSRVQAGYGDFRRVEITLDNMEQDFSLPGPYGH